VTLDEQTTARKPPQDDDAERACLGAMLLASTAIDDVAALITPADHYRPAHETIHQAIADMHGAGKPVDPVTVAHELASRPAERGRTQLDLIGGAPYLHTLTADVPIVANAAHYAGIVLQKAKLRALVAAGTKLASLGYSGDLDQADTYLGDAVEHINHVATRFGATAAESHFDREVHKEADRIRVREAAQAQVRAEKVDSTGFDNYYLDRAGLLDMPAPEPLIDKVLPRHTYAVLRGRDQSFKSFVAIDWACSLATGKSWQGHATETSRVLYIAGEGAHGLAARVAAWEYAWGRHVPADMFTVRRTALDMYQPGPAFDHLLAHVEAGHYGLVIVDTLRRVSGSAAENSSEMGLVINSLDRIKQATDNGTVLVVAHTSKTEGSDTRGHSSIEDDADVVWSVKRDHLFLTLELNKMKDGADGRTLHLEATPTLTSLTLAGLDGLPAANTTEDQLAILDALRVMPEGGVTGPDLMATSQLHKSPFYRALKDLRSAGLVLMTTQGRAKYYELPALDEDTDPSADDPTEPNLLEDTP
jgi:hypothetical protein